MSAVPNNVCFCFCTKVANSVVNRYMRALRQATNRLELKHRKLGKFFEVLKLPVWLAIFCALYSFSCAKAIRDEAAN